MKPDTLTYIEDAIRRIGSGQVSTNAGSHIVGIFGKAATGFEKEFGGFIAHLLRLYKVDYDTRVRPEVHGKPLHKLTLGELMRAFDVVREIVPQVSAAHLTDSVELKTFLGDLRAINSTWVQVKHGDDAPVKDLYDGLIAMRRALQTMSHDA